MPRVTWETETDWLAHYRVWDVATQSNVGYGRTFATKGNPSDGSVPLYNRRWALLRSHFPAISSSDRILVGGCGFGYLIEAAQEDGFSSVWGLDASTYISSNRGTESVGSVLFVEDDIRGGARVRAALRSLTGDDEFDWIITESVLESYDDSEIPPLLAAAETVLASVHPTANIIHLVHAVPHPSFPRSGLDSAFNVKPIDDWKAIEPTHTWVNIICDEEWETR
jgi:hypothetical protein